MKLLLAAIARWWGFNTAPWILHWKPHYSSPSGQSGQWSIAIMFHLLIQSDIQVRFQELALNPSMSPIRSPSANQNVLLVDKDPEREIPLFWAATMHVMELEIWQSRWSNKIEQKKPLKLSNLVDTGLRRAHNPSLTSIQKASLWNKHSD